MKVEPEIRMWVQVFYSEGYPKELEGRGRENETRKAKKTIKEKLLSWSSMRASGTQPHLESSDKSYYMYSKLLPEELEAGAFKH